MTANSGDNFGQRAAGMSRICLDESHKHLSGTIATGPEQVKISTCTRFLEPDLVGRY